MKTLLTILTISKFTKRNKKSLKRSIFTISEVVVDVTTILAEIIILPFTLYKKYKHYTQSKSRVVTPKNVINFSDYKKRKKVS